MRFRGRIKSTSSSAIVWAGVIFERGGGSWALIVAPALSVASLSSAPKSRSSSAFASATTCFRGGDRVNRLDFSGPSPKSISASHTFARDLTVPLEGGRTFDPSRVIVPTPDGPAPTKTRESPEEEVEEEVMDRARLAGEENAENESGRSKSSSASSSVSRCFNLKGELMIEPEPDGRRGEEVDDRLWESESRERGEVEDDGEGGRASCLAGGERSNDGSLVQSSD